jgi:hypothetical protein
MRDYIGLRPCSYIPSLSGMYLDSLPGLEITEIDEVANAEQITFSGVWSDLQDNALDTFREDIIEEFGKRYQLKQVTQTLDLGRNIDINSLTPNNSSMNGLLIETMLQGQQCACSNLQKIYVQSVDFYWTGMNGTPSFTLTFQDADLGNVEYTVTTSAVAGWNTVWIDRAFAARRLYVLASGNMDNFVKLDIANFQLEGFGSTWGWQNNSSSSWLWYNWGGCGCQSRIRGTSYDSNTKTSIEGTNTFGLSVVMNTKCSFESIVCNNKKHFASSFQHLLAIEFLNYRIHSSRKNQWTTISKQQAIELQKLFVLKYRGGKDPDTGISYPGKLQSAVTSIILNDDDCCLKSNSYLLWRETRM